MRVRFLPRPMSGALVGRPGTPSHRVVAVFRMLQAQPPGLMSEAAQALALRCAITPSDFLAVWKTINTSIAGPNLPPAVCLALEGGLPRVMRQWPEALTVLPRAVLQNDLLFFPPRGEMHELGAPPRPQRLSVRKRCGSRC